MELEARNLRHFQQIMGDRDCVKFPTPLFPFVTKSVLVETFEVEPAAAVSVSACHCSYLLWTVLPFISLVCVVYVKNIVFPYFVLSQLV